MQSSGVRELIDRREIDKEERKDRGILSGRERLLIASSTLTRKDKSG